MTVEEQPVAGDSSSGSGDNNMDPTKPRKVNENTLLTPAQTYFADERIQIPETDVSILCLFFF